MRAPASLLVLAALVAVGRRSDTHARITRSRPSSRRDLEGEVKGEVTRVWWQNPHIRYDVAMKMPDGTTQSWALLPPGNLPTYRRENWTEQTIQVGYQVTATGNLGRDDTKKLYATCINVGTGPGERPRSSAAARTRARSRRRRPTRTSTTP